MRVQGCIILALISKFTSRLCLLAVCVCLSVILFSCDVHEFPEAPETVKFYLHLDYNSDITEWEHLYEEGDVKDQSIGDTYNNCRSYGHIRYIVRAYPLVENQRTVREHLYEYVYTKDIIEGYDHEFTMELPEGNYNIMVWSDLIQEEGDAHFHNADDFSEITLHGEHCGNNDHRDAYRGSNTISLVSDIVEYTPETLEISMERPLAKYEFITTDLDEFINKEQTRVDAISKAQSNGASEAITKVNIEDYKVVFYYVGFMPDTYSIFTDKPVDSSTGVLFESKINTLNEGEASIGFDYVFVNGTESAVTVQIGIYDKENTQLSLSDPIEIPLKRSHHTILKGKFMMLEASGGVSINPEYEGDHNLIFP